MIELTQEMFYEEMAKAIVNDLKSKLLKKQQNHCMRVDYLPNSVMKYTCEKMNTDKELKEKRIEAYILTDNAKNTYEVESGRLIELRNRSDFGVLVVFVPQGFKGVAEDSYDIHTFEAYDLADVFVKHKYQLIASLSEEEQAILKPILESSVVRKQSIENQIRYLLAIIKNECTFETAGAYLHYLHLIPDMKLNEDDIQARLFRNHECVEQLSNPDQTVFLAMDGVINKGLDPNHNQIKTHVLNFFFTRNPNDVEKWTKTILTEEEWLKKISFDKWKFKDLIGEQVDVFIDSFRDKDGNPFTYTKLQLEGDNLVATTNTKMRVKWQTNPRKAAVISQFILLLERDEENDNSTELHRKLVKGTNEQTAFPFKDVDLEEGEEWLVHIRIIALDHNKAKITEDTSEPFYLRGQETDIVGEEPKHYNKIRNIAEAILKNTYKNQRRVEIVSQNWETGRKLIYRIKTDPRETYQIALNDLLYDLEVKTLQDPFSCGVWDVNILNRSFIEEDDFKPGEIKLSAFKEEFIEFLDTRRELFHAITSFDDAPVIEILDLRVFKKHIVAYANAYHQLVQNISDTIRKASDAEVNNLLEITHLINRLDTVYIVMGIEEELEEVVLMMPTHPIKIMWMLQYQTLLYTWSDKIVGMNQKEVGKIIDIDTIDKILPLNLPNAISFEKNKMFVNTDVLDLYWSIFPKSTTKDIRKVVAMLSRALGYKDDLGNISSVTPKQIANRLWRYLCHHPYITTLKINVINPGDGLLFLNTIRELHKELHKNEEYKHLRYDITFYGTLGYELMGNAFDALMDENDSTETRSEVDEHLLEPSHNPLFPKLFFSKIRVEPDQWDGVTIKEANITVIIDQFITKTVSRPVSNLSGSYFLHGLLAEYRSEFSVMDSAVTWSRKVIPSKTKEIVEDDSITDLLYLNSKNLVGLSCAYFDWGKSIDHLPTIQLELTKQDKHILSQVHQMSDWVFTIDRNFGIEYFDNPEDSNPQLKSYMIDYTPEFMDGIGHRLIVSTGWVNEIEKLVEDGLRKINIPISSFRASEILDIIKSISGKLALKLINNPNNVREIIGLAITRLALERDGLLENAVLIPIDSHVDFFAENKRRSIEDEVTVKRSDLILVSNQDDELIIEFIEVKFRSGAGDISENLTLKEEIREKNENSVQAFRTKFISEAETPKIDLQLANKSLSTLIGFYLERAIRYGFCSESSGLTKMINRISCGDFHVSFKKTGYIIHWAGTTKPVQNYNNNHIYEIGHEDIIELLKIRETEIEDVQAVSYTHLTLPTKRIV